MQRVLFAGLSAFLMMSLWSGAGVPARGQDRGGGGIGVGVGQPPPGPGVGGVAQPPPPIAGGVGMPQPPFAAPGVGAVALPPSLAGYAYSTRSADYNLGRFFYYPYYYFPHSYWPGESCAWPERPGQPYARPPAYMTYPPFLEPHWRYEWYQPQRYYRGFHFWLDQF